MASAFLLASLAIVATVLLLRFCPVLQAARAMMAAAARARRVLRQGRVSDHWKERAAAGLSVRLFAASARFSALLALVAVPLLLAWFVAPALKVDLGLVLLAWKPRIALVLVTLLANMSINAVKRRSL